MSEEEINKAILTLDVLIDECKEDGTYYTAQKEWEALGVFKKLQQENTQLKSVLKEIREYINKCNFDNAEILYDFGSEYCYIDDFKEHVLEIIDKGIGEDNG
jgi:hypothetical protein